MVPEHGVAAEFGFYDLLKATHVIDASVATTPAGYVVRATTKEVPQIPLTDVTATFFGDPAAKDGAGEGEPHVAMFTNPSDCSGERVVSTVHMDSWQEPGAYASNGTPEGEPLVESPGWVSARSDEWPKGGSVTPATSAPITGCDLLRFAPSAFTVLPDIATGGSSSGGGSTTAVSKSDSPDVVATPPLSDEVVTLPLGLIPNPAAASGLEGCSEVQIGWLGETKAIISNQRTSLACGASEVGRGQESLSSQAAVKLKRMVMRTEAERRAEGQGLVNPVARGSYLHDVRSGVQSGSGEGSLRLSISRRASERIIAMSGSSSCSKAAINSPRMSRASSGLASAVRMRALL